jgi:hypothetical protein
MYADIYRLTDFFHTQALAELDRAKTTFFSNISHEFRTPLTLMLGPLEDLLDQAELQIEKEQLTLIHRNALRLYKLVNSLLDFSRLEAGRAQANYEPVDLASFTQDLASIFRSAIERYDRLLPPRSALVRPSCVLTKERGDVIASHRAGLELLVECEELEQPVYVDKDMWEKIVLNLLSNALKFTMHGHIHVAVKSVLGMKLISALHHVLRLAQLTKSAFLCRCHGTGGGADGGGHRHRHSERGAAPAGQALPPRANARRSIARRHRHRCANPPHTHSLLSSSCFRSRYLLSMQGWLWCLS